MLRRRSSQFGYIYGAGLLLALHSAFTVYINSNFLSEFLSEKSIDILYTTAALETLIGLILIPRLIRKFGAFPLFAIGLVIQIIALCGLATSTDALYIALFFVIYQMLPTLLYFFVDVFLEGAITTERITGRIRSNYLTILNAAFVVSPFMVGYIVSATSYRFIYYLAAVFVSALFLLGIIKLRNRKAHSFKDIDFGHSLASFHHRKGLVKVFSLNLLLYCFYAVMVIYTPLYLHKTIGFDWPTIGMLFTIMLVPFVLFEAPLGRIFDRAHKERSAIIFGFMVMMFTSIAMFMTASTSFLVWAVILFTSRVGASFVEIGVEYSFFKRVDDRHAGLISVFRTASPFAYVVAPLVAGAISGLLSIQHIFLAVSLVMLIGMLTASTLTKPPHPARIS